MDDEMVPQSFGGTWTEEKLQALESYLKAYLRIFTQNPKASAFTRHYVDAFAGSGLRQVQQQENTLELPDFNEAVGFMDGSPRRVLSLDEAFHKYWFIEKSRTSASRLNAMIGSDFPLRSERCSVQSIDANEFFTDWCGSLGRGDRGVVFLDPFAMTCKWETVEQIARTQKIDLWILFPVMAVIRTLPRAGPREDWKPALTRLFGTADWEEYFYRPGTMDDLFGAEPQSERHVDSQRIIQYYVERLKTVFAAVTEHPKVLYNHRGSPLFGLAFAAGNPRGAKTAIRIAKHLTEQPPRR